MSEHRFIIRVRKLPVNWRWVVIYAATMVVVLMSAGFFILSWQLAARRHDNQTSTMQMLKNLSTAEVSYSLGLGKGNYTGNLQNLLPQCDLCLGFVDNNVVQAQTIPKSGYQLGKVALTPKTETEEAHYSITAYPEVKTGLWRTGDDCFYVDDSGVIRHSGSATIPADDNSPPL